MSDLRQATADAVLDRLLPWAEGKALMSQDETWGPDCVRCGHPDPVGDCPATADGVHVLSGPELHAKGMRAGLKLLLEDPALDPHPQARAVVHDHLERCEALVSRKSACRAQGGECDCICDCDEHCKTAAELADKWVKHYQQAIERGTGDPAVCRDQIDRWLDHRIDHGNEPRQPL